MRHRNGLIGLLGLAVILLSLAHPLAAAQPQQTVTPSPTPQVKPFALPFADPPGPGTWYLGQGYGNTIGAYYQRDTTYRAGQGLHFGLDFAAPCGTPVLAIGDGVVAKVDAPEHGALPHNLMLRLDAGYAALYGHLLQRSKLAVGARVKQGDVVGLSGDSFGTCHSAPHLHLEIRSLDYLTAYDPINLINADWDSLALVGAYQRGFERDLADPRRWQFPDDQPDTKFGGPLLNNYPQPWPPDWYRRK
jgi:murein DD-endopeptidase MepM/ murein hydrolase activator NlpD